MRRHQPGWQNNWELTSPEANISPYRAAVLIPSAAGSGSIFTTRSNKSFCSLEQKAGSGSPLWEVLQEKYLEICFLLLLFIFACLFFFLSFFFNPCNEFPGGDVSAEICRSQHPRSLPGSGDINTSS